MINWKLISKILGSLLFVEAFLLSVCLVISLGYGERDTAAFALTAAITAAAGLVLRLVGAGAGNTLLRREAYFVVTATWVVFSVFGMLPFLLCGALADVTNAFFETMSGFTTTGATILDDVERLPHALLFWRSLTQWIGGLGIVFFTIALLPSLVGGSVKVFAAEATGPIRTKLHPRLSMSAKWIWMIYIVLTIACAATYGALGMDWFELLNHAMTTTATGGFSTHNDSMDFFRSPSIEYACTFFCFLSGVNFTLLYSAVAHVRPMELWRNVECRFYIVMVAVLSVFITAELFIVNDYDFPRALRCGVFQVVTFITSTGYFNDDAGTWPHVTWAALGLCMFIGACSGSTSGGIKAIRATMLIQTIRNELRKMLHPNAVLPLRVSGVSVPTDKSLTLLAFLSAYILLCLVCSFTFVAFGVDGVNSITITMSCIGNVGPSLGMDIGPTMSWNMLPAGAKWVCAALMLVGRLEIFSVLVVFTPSFWKDR